MALDNLRDFLRALDARGELVHVGHPVSVDKEITEIADRCMKSPGGGPALLFQHPTLLAGGPSRYPVAVNLFGSERRRSEEHTSELQSRLHLVCRLLLEKKKNKVHQQPQ